MCDIAARPDAGRRARHLHARPAASSRQTWQQRGARPGPVAHGVPARQVLLFAEVFSAKVFPHVYGLLRAGTPEAIAQTEASLTAGLTARPRPCAMWFRARVGVPLPPLVLLLHATLACGPDPRAAYARGARVGRRWCDGGAAARRQTLDAFLRRHGSEEGGAYLLGGRYSFAETAASPFLLRMLVVLPHYRGFDAAAVARERGLKRLSAWLEVRPTVMLAHALNRPGESMLCC